MSVVTPEDISLIPKRYCIGKRPLSLLLGWGELTYTRLLDGNTPTAQHAAELRRLLDDPAAFARLLEVGRNRITELAYTRSMRAVDELLADEGGALEATKIFAVADRLCILAHGDLTPGALHCLVYYAQGTGLAKLGHSLFGEFPRAAASGPVYDRIYEGYTFDEIQRVSMAHADASKDEKDGPSFDQELLTAEEVAVIDAVYRRYGDYSGQKLASMVRDEAPWRKARKRADAKSGDDSNERLTAKSMQKFFGKSK